MYLRMTDENDSWRNQCNFDLSQQYRVGMTSTGLETCTPRLLCIDTKENMVAFNPEHGVYGQQSATTAASAHSTESGSSQLDIFWSGQVTTIKSEPIHKNSFQRMLEFEATLAENDESDPVSSVGQQVEKEEEDEYYEGIADSEVRSWLDYLKIHIHPKSVYHLPLRRGYNFDTVFTGRAGSGNLSADGIEDILDRVR